MNKQPQFFANITGAHLPIRGSIKLSHPAEPNQLLDPQSGDFLVMAHSFYPDLGDVAVLLFKHGSIDLNCEVYPLDSPIKQASPNTIVYRPQRWPIKTGEFRQMLKAMFPSLLIETEPPPHSIVESEEFKLKIRNI